MTTKFINKIVNILLSDRPSLNEINAVALKNGVSKKEFTRSLYEIVKNIHTSIFPPILQMELVLTEGCNLGCKYCFEKDMLSSRRMDTDVGKKAIDLLIDYSGSERELHVSHFGGEPMVNMNALREITDYANNLASRKNKHIYFNMTTNGILIDESKAKYFRDQNINVMISIDGLNISNDLFRIDKKGNGTFERISKNILLLKKYQPWIGIKMTVMPENVNRLYSDVVGLYEIGVNQFTIGHATGVNWTDDIIKQYFQQMKMLKNWYSRQDKNLISIIEFDEVIKKKGYFGCQAGRSSISVSINGEISPCSKILALNTKDLVSKLGDVDHGLYLLNNRTQLVSTQKLKKNCSSMNIHDEYQGGCFAVNYTESGDLFMPSLQEHVMTNSETG